MEIHCTRPDCARPLNHFRDLDDRNILKTTQQKYCTACGMELILAGRYIPSKLLARGGFGTAYLAKDRYTPAMRTCLVKQFQPEGDLTPDQLETARNLFDREAEVLEDLGSQHLQIPNLLANFQITAPALVSGAPQEFFYLVQEFIDGENLEQELECKGQFSEAEVTEVLKEILKILQFVHDRGSIHRDIKPANIMRHRNGRLYLLDFGAVKQVTTTGTPKTRSTGIYSLGFAPPEQMAGGQIYPSTDLYALAVMAVNLLTGKPPQDLFDSYSNQWNWRGYVPVSDRLEGILNRMLKAAPAERFASAAEAIAALSTPNPATPTASSTTIQPPASAPVPAPTPAPAPVPAPAPRSAPIPPTATPAPSGSSFSTLELLAGAAFTGFEGGLVGVALGSLLGLSGLSAGIWGAIVGALAFIQSRRWIEGKDLPIIGVLSLALVLFVPGLRVYPIGSVLAIALLAGLSAIAVTTLFRLIYRLISSIL